MRGLQSGLSWLVLFAWLATIGCSGFFFSSNNGRLLVVVSVDPVSANASQFTNGQVQFTASGTFNRSPTSVNPLGSVVWTVDHPAFSGLPDSGHATITADGVAQCAMDFSSSVTVFATAAADPTQPVSLSNEKVGTAQLMCP